MAWPLAEELFFAASLIGLMFVLLLSVGGVLCITLLTHYISSYKVTKYATGVQVLV